MAKNFNPDKDPALATGNIPLGTTGGEGTELQFDKNLKPNRPAIADEKEALDLCKALVAANQARIKRDAYFLSKLDGDPPHEQTKLKNSGCGWQSNVSSGLLSTILNRVLPAFARVINSTKYLTNISIKDDTAKSIALQEAITKTIRSWSGWQDLHTDFCYENTSLGRAVITFGDKYTPWGKFYSTSNALLPEGCSQDLDKVPFMVLLDDRPLFEFFEDIKDREKAEGAGWNIPNCVKAMNTAAPSKREQDKDREYEDWLTQGAYSSTFSHMSSGSNTSEPAKPKTVNTFTVLAVEPDKEGKVTEWVITREDGLLLYKNECKYDKLSEAATLLTYTRGNGTAHGSKGLCRLLMNLHNVYDRNFNKVMDDSFLAGCRTMEMPTGKRINTAIKVQHPFVLVPEGCTTQPFNPGINVDIFYAIIRQIQGLAEQTAGSYIPSALAPSGASDKTATEATIDAQQNAEVKEGILGRFLFQFQKLITTMVHRLLDAKTYDKDAKALQKKLIDELGITREQLDEALEQHSLDNLTDYSSTMRNQKILGFVKMVGPDNPAYDNAKLATLVAETAVDAEFAKDVVIVKPDPAADVAAENKAQLENAALQGGKLSKLTPDPLDNDIVHLIEHAKGAGEFMGRQPIPNTDTLVATKAQGAHIVAHIEQAKAKGKVKPADLKPFEDILAQLHQSLQNYAKQLAKIGQAVSSGLPPQPPEAPQPPPGAGAIPAV